MKRVLFIILCMLPVLASEAQSVNRQVRIENQSASRGKDNRLTIAMDVILDGDLKVKPNNSAVFTPMLQLGGNQKALPEIIVNGRRRQIVNERNKKLPIDSYKILRRENKKEQRISYLVQIPYEKWMQKAEIGVNVDLCGCCNVKESSLSNVLYKLSLEPDRIEPVIPQPSIAYITPKAEAVKHRAIVGKAYLDFPVNQTVVYPDYRNNKVELGKIFATIDTVRNDKNTSMTGIKIVGFASPEGSYASNARLAEGRSDALMKYVSNYYNFDTRIVGKSSIPEDWDGLRQYVETSIMAKKDEVLALIDNKNMDYDVKEKAIAKLIGPDAYRFLLDDCYKTLRRSEYTVSYTVRGFNLEESKEIILKNPQQLSLQEIFNVAQTYEKGGKEFNHAFNAAVLMFPNDPIANLNAAAMELHKGGDLSAIRKYLEKADRLDPATLNNLGVLELLSGNLDKAEEYLTKAVVLKSDEAKLNLVEVAKQREYREQLKANQ